MARTKQTMRRAPEPTRAEVEAAWNAARNRKPTPESDIDWSSPRSPLRSSDGGDVDDSGSLASDGAAAEEEWWSSSEDEYDRSASASRAATSSSAERATTSESDSVEPIDMEHLEDVYIERFRAFWAMYLHKSTMEGTWAFFELEDLKRALEKKNAIDKLHYELDVLGYVRDPDDSAHLVHRKYNDIHLDRMDMFTLSHDVRCHLYYVFVALKRARRRVKLLQTRYINRPNWESTRRQQEWDGREGMQISGAGIKSTAEQEAERAAAEEDAWFQVDDDDDYQVFVDEAGAREAQAREARVGSG